MREIKETVFEQNIRELKRLSNQYMLENQETKVVRKCPGFGCWFDVIDTGKTNDCGEKIFHCYSCGDFPESGVKKWITAVQDKKKWES